MNDYLFSKYTLENDPRGLEYTGYGYAPDMTLGMATVGGQKTTVDGGEHQGENK